MSEDEIDYLFVGIVFIIFTIAVFLGFGHSSKFQATDDDLGGFIACLGFLIYGGAGLIRRRILFGSAARLLKGIRAITVSVFFFVLGCIGIFEFIRKYLLK